MDSDMNSECSGGNTDVPPQQADGWELLPDWSQTPLGWNGILAMKHGNRCRIHNTLTQGTPQRERERASLWPSARTVSLTLLRALWGGLRL